MGGHYQTNFSEGFMRILRIAVLVVLLTFSVALATEVAPVKPSTKDKCPVCGMFVAKYPDFLAQISFQDGSHAFFDGAKDMFKYYFDLHKYNPSQSLSKIAAIYVTDYYSLAAIDGRKAWYVIGSDVYGPMGRELIPFAREDEAREFMEDHGGGKVLAFEVVSPDVIAGLD